MKPLNFLLQLQHLVPALGVPDVELLFQSPQIVFNLNELLLRIVLSALASMPC